MTWDLFSAAAAESAGRGESALARNEALARRVALQQLEGGAPLIEVRAEGWSVSDVNAAARELIEGALPPLWVRGEVTNFTRARSGHCYFSLRDEEAQLRCVMWRDEARRLPTAPAEGMEVRALGRLTIYPSRGEFQLVVSELEGRGEGLWRLAFERLRTTLQAEGLLAAERKRPLPRMPRSVGVVTSGEGAALHDIVSVIRRRAPWTEIVLSSCRVQGEGAAEEIAGALRRLYRAECAEVIIVGRGGGSVEDLWAFNEETVARAISESPVPVVSAVGHESDFTIADLVADVRAPTPSAAAEQVVPDARALARELAALEGRLTEGVLGRVADGRRALEHRRREVSIAAERLLRTRRERLGAAAGRLQALSPLGTLARGYALPSVEGRLLRRAAEFEPGLGFELRVADGEVRCRVEG